MAIEFETKVLNIDSQKVIAILRNLGAKETPEYLMRRYIFDMESKDIEWIRLRDEMGKVTMTYKYKKLGNKKIGKTIEIEVEVSDFEKTAKILRNVKFKKILFQENRIHIFRIDDIEFSIAHWPLIDPYLEIESTSKAGVDRGLELLGLTGKDSGDLDIKEIYTKKDISLNDILELKFG